MTAGGSEDRRRPEALGNEYCRSLGQGYANEAKAEGVTGNLQAGQSEQNQLARFSAPSCWGAMRNGLMLLNVQAFYQLLATGIIIILAMPGGSIHARKE